MQNEPMQNENLALNLEELKTLNDYLIRSKCEMNVINLHGFFTAIASSPVRIIPNEWIPLIFGLEYGKSWLSNNKPNFLSEDEGKQIIILLHRLQESIMLQLKEGKPFTPLISLVDFNADIHLESSFENLQEWCMGYLFIVNNYMKTWSVAPDVFIPLFSFSVIVGNRSVLNTFENEKELKDEIKRSINSLPASIQAVYQFWQDHHYADIVKESISDRFRELYKKQNELCSCGSNLKRVVCCDRKKFKELALKQMAPCSCGSSLKYRDCCGKQK